MAEQGAVVFPNEGESVWESIIPDGNNPARIWKTEKAALRELAKDGWKIEGVFRMRQRKPVCPTCGLSGKGCRGQFS